MLSVVMPIVAREQTEDQHLELHVAGGPVDELREQGAEDHERLRVGHPDHEPLPDARRQ